MSNDGDEGVHGPPEHQRESVPLARGAAVVTAVVAAAVFVGLAAALVPWAWVPGGHLQPMTPGQLFSHAQIVRADAYSSQATVLGLGSYAVSLVIALVLGLTPIGARLMGRISQWLPGLMRRGMPWWLSVPIGSFVILMIGRLVTLPLSLSLRQVELRYGLTHQNLLGWARDTTTSFLVSWVISSLVVLVIIGAARRSPRWWFLWAGGVSLLLTVAGSFLYPVLVEPLFNRFTPMHPGPLRASIFQLAHREGVHIDDVLVADASRRTTTVNAYVSGFGSTRRVVVYDTLLKDLPPAQVRIVVAHELGHAKHNDVVTGTALGAVGSVLGIALLALLLDTERTRRQSGTAGAADPAAVALILALISLGTFVASPVQNTISRAIEARADRAAIAATGQGQEFVRMQRQIAVRSLSDPSPPEVLQFWFGDHPTAVQRAGLPASLAAAGR